MVSKRILHVVRQFYPSQGGMEQFVLELCKQQLKQGHQLTVLTLNSHFTTGQLYAEEDKLDLQFGELQIKRIAFCGSSLCFLPDLKRFDWSAYDLIHIHGLDMFLHRLVSLKQSARITCPLYLSTHGGFFHTRRLWWLKQLWFYWLTAKDLRSIERVYACSVADFLKFQAISDKVELVENGVDIKQFNGMQKSLDIEHLLYVGGCRSNKRVTLLIKWFKRLTSLHPQLKLTVVGGGEELSTARQLVDDLELAGQVEFKQNLAREELVALYQQAGIFVSASDYEGFGLSVVEAMAAGCILLLNRIPSFELFVPEGLNGRIIDFDQQSNWLSGFESIYNLPQEVLQKMSKESLALSKRYDWELVARKFY